MTPPLHVSLVIVSHKRPDALRRLLVSLRTQTYPDFEVIVVSDSDPRQDFPDLWHIDRVKHVSFNQTNISAARNLGVAAASAGIIAFCDDDAVPEPTWLAYLTAEFSNLSVGAVGGYVLGRNGISFQWQACGFDRYGRDHAIKPWGDTPRIFNGDARQGIKTQGTNCAFRRAALIDVGGFDEAYKFYLDETDLNYRLGLKGWKTAIVPLAQVHHGYAASRLRNHARVPKSLFEIGASQAYFMNRYGARDKVSQVAKEFIKKQEKRLINMMLRGDLEPGDVPRLLEGLRQGMLDGGRRKIIGSLRYPATTAEFRSFQNGDRPTGAVFLAGPWFAARALDRRARALVAAGKIVTVFRFTHTAMFHRHKFTDRGYWQQTGGIYGRADRTSRLFKPTTLVARAGFEISRLSNVRPNGKLIFC